MPDGEVKMNLATVNLKVNPGLGIEEKRGLAARDFRRRPVAPDWAAN
jgi:hypothetical protein